MKSVELLLISCWMAAISPAAFAADAYPSRNIRLIVPVGAGGSADYVARIVADRLRNGLGQQVLVDNRPGASGILGSDMVAKATPDGYTLLLVYPSHPVNPSLYKDMPYDTVKDFAPISMVASISLVLLVDGSSPIQSVKDLIARAAAKPGQLNFAVVGAGSLGSLGAELFASLTGIRLTAIPYKGVPQSQAALISGEVQIFFDTPVTSISQVKAGRLRALGVSTKTRLANLPDVPTIAEAGVPGYEVTSWNGILAPAKTPRAIIDRLNKEIVNVLRTPEVIEQVSAQGIGLVGSTPEEFASAIKTDIEKWAKVIKVAGIKAN